LEEDNRADAGRLFDGVWEDNKMDANTLPSVESDDPIDDLDLSFRQEDAFD
jgi:hypothetical protein